MQVIRKLKSNNFVLSLIISALQNPVLTNKNVIAEHQNRYNFVIGGCILRPFCI